MKTYGALDLAGLTGATQATRWVGGTTSGPPTTGTFAIGDYVVARDGAVFICTAAGSPGTWLDMSSGKELAHAEVTAANITTTATTDANRVDAGGLIISPVVGTRPIIVEFWGNVLQATATSSAVLFIIEAAAGDTNRTPIITKATCNSSVAGAVHPVVLKARLAPSAGTHTYKIQFTGTAGAGTSTIACNVANPSFIRAYNV